MACEFLKFAVLLLLAAGAACANDGLRTRTAGIVVSGLPDENIGLADELRRTLGEAGYDVRTAGFDDICDSARLTPATYDLLVMPDCSSLPAGSVEPIEGYLRAGGDLIALNAPMWRRVLYKVSGEWMTRDEFVARGVRFAESRVAVDYHPDAMRAWQLSNSNPVAGLIHEVIEQGPLEGDRALHVKVPKLLGWDAYVLPEVDAPFRDGAALTVFWAKGGAHTPQMGIEWGERDGSRWIAVVNLTPDWNRYILTPQDFHYHPSNSSRGFAGDCFRPENAKSFNVQVAVGVTAFTGENEQEFWIGPVSTARPSAEAEEVFRPLNLPALDTLCPAYHLFECTGVSHLRAIGFDGSTASRQLAVPASLSAAYTRPSAAGFDKGRTWKYAPLMEAYSADREWRGNPASLMVHAEGDYKGGVWASLGVHDLDWYRSGQAMELIRRTAAAMNEGLFIIDGGANFFTYFENQQMKLGIRAANLGGPARYVTVRLTVTAPGAKKASFAWSNSIELPPGAVRSVCTYWKPLRWPDQGYEIKAELLADGRIVDSISHRAYVWTPKPKPRYVTVKNGHFELNGRPWKPHGVNYMPSSGQAHEDYKFFNNWLGGRSYDPVVVQRDLEKIRELGFNSVSVFLLHEAASQQNLLDFLRRCGLLGLRVNLYLGPSAPRDYRFEPIKQMIEFYRLPENDTLFAYDIDWEPLWGPHDYRTRWDRDWERWIVDRYGGIENAERDWGFPVPRNEDGKVTNPAAEQIDNDGEWRRMVAAYRRFLDTLAYKYYSRAARLVKSVDPNHLVSFRMSYGGCPTYKGGGWISYDFACLGACLDFLSPEAYGLVGDWERAKPGWFEREYARWAAPRLPMLWAEAGFSVWDAGRGSPAPERLKYQAMVYRNFYELMIKSGADGIYWWFYPGGFRFEERSDCGVVNPDGSDRPATRVIREYACRFTESGSAGPVTDWITIDRDRRADGLYGIYEQTQQDFWNLMGNGRTPGLKTDGTGTTSANCPLVAVGNTPCNGSNPPKYLDAAFDSVEILDSRGRWTPVPDGGSVRVDPSRPVTARVRLTNLGEAAWLHRGPGAVKLIAEGRSAIRTSLQRSVPYLGYVVLDGAVLSGPIGAQASQVVLTLSAEGRVLFGEKYRIELLP